MRPVNQSLVQSYMSARARAVRFLRDSSPPLSKKGLATKLGLETSALTKFINGTVLVNINGQVVPISEAAASAELYLREKWTEARLRRYIERVETECWRLGIVHQANASIESAARNETEKLRLSKYFHYLCDIKDAANLGVESALSLWNVCAQEATDARKHLQPTMIVNALVALGDIVDRKEEGQLNICMRGSRAKLAQHWETIHAVEQLIQTVHATTGSPCEHPHTTKTYECFHKSHGYGGYDLFFLGLGTDSSEVQSQGVRHLFCAVAANHHPNDGHVANTATLIETALVRQIPAAIHWADEFANLIRSRFEERDGDDPACRRLKDLQIPTLKQRWCSDPSICALWKPPICHSS